MENKITIKMDIRGFIRFSNHSVKDLKIDKNPYADVEIDTVGKRIAVTPTKTLKYRRCGPQDFFDLAA